MTNDPWDDATIAKLRKLWANGLSTGKIGDALNMSKNSIVGKAHRLNLPKRPSPIRHRDGEPPPPKISGAAKVTLPPLEASAWAPLPSAPALDEIPTSPPRYFGARRAEASKPCCWPIGEPGTPSFHFCNAVSLSGRPYCQDHAEMAYVRVGDRREDVA